VTVKAFAGLVFMLLVLAGLLFGPAWTVDYWQAWLFLAVFGGLCAAITVYLAVRDPALLARRMKAGPAAERDPVQRVIQSVATLAFVAVFVVASLDRRAGWSHVPTALVVAGEALVALGLAMVFVVYRANTYTAAIITVEREQQLVSTGPYAVVRHPMYAGGIVMMLGVPFALGSWWALLTLPPFVAVIVWRLLEEEKLLVTSLPGYPEYRARVRSRLVPFVW
jgi:protein-S-isoprenylcysteine O-methyltransferase Ste14